MILIKVFYGNRVDNHRHLSLTLGKVQIVGNEG